MKCEEDLKVREQLEGDVEKYRLELEDMKVKLSQEMDRFVFLEEDYEHSQQVLTVIFLLRHFIYTVFQKTWLCFQQ